MAEMMTRQTVPGLHDVMTYKGIYALSDIDDNTGFLKVSHWACCLTYGPRPVWGVWTLNGKFLRFYGFKADIIAAYPKKLWRRKAARWSMEDVGDRDATMKRQELAAHYKAPLPTYETPEETKSLGKQLKALNKG